MLIGICLTRFTFTGRSALQVPPGSAVPTDGIVLRGASTVDESMITGESLPVTKRAGDTVVGGTMNRSGVLWVEVRAVGQETVLSHIMQVVANAQMRRPAVQVRQCMYMHLCISLSVYIIYRYTLCRWSQTRRCAVQLYR